MRISLLLTVLFTASLCRAQMRPLDKVYIVEGVVADRETLKAIPSAILYNDTLGITTTSDENGYFKLVVPHDLITQRKNINIDILKTGYKRNGSGFSYNPVKEDTGHTAPDAREVYNYDVKIFLMASQNSSSLSTCMAHIPAREGVHGPEVIRLAFNQAVTSQLRSRKADQLKEGNDLVYFIIDRRVWLATSSYDLYFDDSSPIVFIDDRRVKLKDINKLVKRSTATVDNDQSATLSKKYGRDVIALRSNN